MKFELLGDVSVVFFYGDWILTGRLSIGLLSGPGAGYPIRESFVMSTHNSRWSESGLISPNPDMPAAWIFSPALHQIPSIGMLL